MEKICIIITAGSEIDLGLVDINRNLDLYNKPYLKTVDVTHNPDPKQCWCFLVLPSFQNPAQHMLWSSFY